MNTMLRFFLEVAVLLVAFAAEPALAIRVGRKLKVEIAHHDEITFKNQKTVHIPPDNQAIFCFRNKVDCIDYRYSVKSEELGGEAEPILVFVALRDDIKGGAMNGSVCRGSNCARENIKVSNNLDYCIVLANSQYSDPKFNNASSKHVEVVIEMEGCPTTAQIVIFVAVPLAVIFGVLVCISLCYIRFRKKAKHDHGIPVKQLSIEHGRHDPQMIVNPIHQPLPYGGQHAPGPTVTPYTSSGKMNVQSNVYPVQVTGV